MLSKKLRELTNEDIDKISNIYTNFIKGQDINEQGLAKSIFKEELINNDYSFVPGRYVEIIEEKIEETKTKEKIKTLGNELDKLFNEFEELVPMVKESIKKAIEFKKED